MKKGSKKMMNSIKKMTFIGVAVTVLVLSLAAAPAMANNNEEAQDEHKKAQDEEPLKDPGIRLCDIVPTECDNTDNSQDNNKKNEHNNNDDEYQEYCNNPMLVYDPTCDKNNDRDEYPEYCQYPSFAYDPACDKQNQGHDDYSKADPDTKTPNPGKDEEPLKDPGIRLCDIAPTECQKNTEEDSAQKTPVVVRDPRNDSSSNSDEVGQLANSSGQIANSEAYSSPTTTGCPFDYEYDEDADRCFPSFDFIPLLSGDQPAPDSFGGYVGLPGHAVGDLLKGMGWVTQTVYGHFIGDTLVGYGEDVGAPLGYGLQGLGYTVVFATDAAGLALEGAGEIVGAVTDGVAKVVDTVFDNTVYPVLEHVVVEGVETVVESVEKVADAVGSTAKKIFCKIFC